MISGTERIKKQMGSIFDNEERILAAVRLDPLFTTFEIEMTPAETFGFAENAATAGVPRLSSIVESINRVIPPANFGPEHEKTGHPHHHFRVGREGGRRILKIEIFKGFFQLDYDFLGLMETIHSIGVGAAADVAIDVDNNSYSIVMRWAPPPTTGGLTA